MTAPLPYPATGTEQQFADWMRRNTIGIPKESLLPLRYPDALDTVAVRGRERSRFLDALNSEVRREQGRGIKKRDAIPLVLNQLRDEFKSEAGAYLDGTKDIGNLEQQLKNRKRGGLPASMTRVATNHIVIAFIFEQFDDAARMYKRSDHSVRKQARAFFNKLIS